MSKQEVIIMVCYVRFLKKQIKKSNDVQLKVCLYAVIRILITTLRLIVLSRQKIDSVIYSQQSFFSIIFNASSNFI